MSAVSFFIVIRVVAQGQCSKKKTITHIAVIGVQPFALNNWNMESIVPTSDIELLFVYVIIIIGITISFAGIPKINDKSITPSRPINLPMGSKNCADNVSKDISFISVLARHQIIIPAGIAEVTALAKTNIVRSKIECIITSAILGLR